jgi:integrase
VARAVNRLKDVTVRRATKPGMYADGAGLYLRVGPTGAKAWVFRYRRDGKLHDLGLGPLNAVGLASARQRAQRCREQRLDGIDPLGAKRAGRDAARLAAAKSVTFKDCADAYVSAHQVAWRNAAWRKQWPAILTAYVYPVFGAMPVHEIDTALVMKAIEPLWTTKTVTASRLRGQIESVLDWARTRGYRQGENPARWRGHLENLLPSERKVRLVKHHPALPYAEMAVFMAELRRQNCVAARALEFTILTSARVGEVFQARWAEVDIGERLWTIPASKMKSGRQHRVPLSGAAIAVVEEMGAIRQNDLLFPGYKGHTFKHTALHNLLHKMGHTNITIHGFRSSFRDWAAEISGFPAEVAEMALAHQVGSAVERAYRRSDLFARRRQLAEAWSAFCAGSPAGEVVLLHQAV